MLERATRMNDLFDFYDVLLTDKQRQYIHLYYVEDYSLGEISDILHVSRQAIYDNIKRTEDVLESYEERLRLYDKFTQREILIEDIVEQLTRKKTHDDILQTVNALKHIE